MRCQVNQPKAFLIKKPEPRGAGPQAALRAPCELSHAPGDAALLILPGLVLPVARRRASARLPAFGMGVDRAHDCVSGQWRWLPGTARGAAQAGTSARVYGRRSVFKGARARVAEVCLATSTTVGSDVRCYPIRGGSSHRLPARAAGRETGPPGACRSGMTGRRPSGPIRPQGIEVQDPDLDAIDLDHAALPKLRQSPGEGFRGDAKA